MLKLAEVPALFNIIGIRNANYVEPCFLLADAI